MKILKIKLLLSKQKPSRTLTSVELLKEWYNEDLNQIPVSYILNQRDPKSDYKEFDNWSVESILRSIIQEGKSRIQI